ncbi:MAG: amidohydrolase family protein [Candidatus Hydrogenedentes bacterium]|nr:amidohydrolase family protein [Candidatus Hydrogenedentota bacterium]
MRIDAHVHLPVTGDDRTFDKAKDLLLCDMREHDVEYAILIPDNVSGSPIGDTETALSLFESTPNIFVMGTIDIQRQGQEWIARLDELMTRRRIVGMKIFPGHDPIYPTDPRLFPIYNLCQTQGVPVVIHTGWNTNHPEVAKYNDPKYIVEVARLYPALSIVNAHFFWPDVEYCYRLTNPVPNIFYDTSALADEEVIRETGIDRIRKALSDTMAGDPRRIIFGTDYAMCDVEAHIELIRSLSLSGDDEERVFWRNAARVFRLPVGGGAW